MKSYYIASGLENAVQVRELKAVLDAAGWHHTYDWTVHGAVEVDQLAEISAAETVGVTTADVIIALLPGGRGTHTELGMAIGQTVLALSLQAAGIAEEVNRRIVVYSPDPENAFRTKGKTCAFYHHPCVERFGDWNEMINSLLGAH